MLETILEALSLFVLNTIESFGYIGIFLLSALESANIPIPSEIILPFSGFLAAGGVFGFWVVVFMGAFGNLAGSLVSYWVAIHFSERIKKNRDFKTAERFFERFGELSVFVARFLPVIRTFISFPAGIFRVNLLRFSIYTFIGSFLWSWLLTYVGFFLGENWSVIGPYFRKFDYVIVGILGVGFIWFVWHHIKRNRESGIKNQGKVSGHSS